MMELNNYYFEAVFVRPKNMDKMPHKGFVMLFYKGQPLGLVSDFKITSDHDGFLLGFQVPIRPDCIQSVTEEELDAFLKKKE